jgi:hypothetical protein
MQESPKQVQNILMDYWKNKEIKPNSEKETYKKEDTFK